MMQLADMKKCWLADLDDVPSEELALWVAYYQMKEREEKRQREQAKSQRN